ncbi:MAG: flavodoxin family protein [Actinobacteria bacterium]|nr:flavodoxin family protein [Actinomycetota bacterium]
MVIKMIDNKDYKVVAVYGSPRRGGNTDVLLDRFLEGLSQYESFKQNSSLKLELDRIIVSELNISPCRECRSCSSTGECIVRDDMQALYPKIIDCDLLAIASPVFFTTVSGYLKVFIDRFQRFWALKYELGRNIITKDNRKGILFCCAGSKPGSIFDCPKKVMRSLFDVLYIKYYADFLYNDIDFKGDILKNSEAINDVYEFGKSGIFIREV